MLSCDNLPSNGETTRNVLARLAALRDPDRGRWVEGEVACSSCMVDRIVPATTPEDRARIAERLGCEDSGATMVANVAPFELAKLRLLNGSPSTLAYLGVLAGYETVAEAIGDANFTRVIADLVAREVAPTLDAAALGDLASYQRDLLARFRNPALRHRTQQIAMDGSQKLPQRLLATVRERLAANQPIARLALGVAAWMRYVTGFDEQRRPIDVRDPLSGRLKAIADRVGRVAARLAPALAGVRELFGADLAEEPRFMAPVTEALAMLIEEGSRRAVARFAQDAAP